MEKQIVSRVYKSYIHRNYESAIFQLHFGNLKDKDMFLGIFYYDLGNFAKCISLLKRYNTHTAKFYVGLCYGKQKKYSKAIEALLEITTNCTQQDERHGNELDNFFITDFEHVHELLGEMYTLNKEREIAIEHFTCSFQINPLVKSFENLVSENVAIKHKKVISMEDGYFCDVLQFDEQTINKYKKHVPGIGSLFISHCAKVFAIRSKNTESVALFEFLRKRDSHYIKHLDYFSTLLWFSEDSTRLACLAKEMLANHSDSHIFWIVLGNYFSNRSDNQRAITCFLRSTYIKNNHNALSLLGHEALLRGEYKNALQYFNQSQELFKNNYNAIFSVGIVYDNSGRYENAEVYYQKGLKINPHNTTLKTVLLQFYIKTKEYTKAMSLIASVFNVDIINVDEICNKIIEQRLNSAEENIVLIFIDVLLNLKDVQNAEKVLKAVKVRNCEYFTKKNMIDELKIQNE
ncbi:Anaphase-promoting complex subunit 8 [Binucleata daphniae]